MFGHDKRLSSGWRIALVRVAYCPLKNLVVDDLIELLTNNGIRSQGYADDIVILARDKFEYTLCDRGLGLAKG